MALVECHDQIRPYSISQHRDEGVSTTEREVAIAFHELGDCRPVIRCRRFDLEGTETTQERGLNLGAESLPDKVRHFSYHQDRDEELDVGALEDFEAPRMVLIVGVGGRVQRAGVNDGDHGPIRLGGSSR